jgi:hypothetical protein
MSDDEAFDLSAAELRADAAEREISIELLGSRLEQALPQIVSVKRQKVGGLLSRRAEIQRIVVDLGEERFELLHDTGSVRCSRNRVVRGIVLSREELPLARWIDDLLAGVGRRAGVGEQDRLAIEKLLR